ncbi:hypothetical protein GCM10022243_53690 [Saccharothrix violaceirubra]|uniref:Uncharacterized protein n=1 Tax=Saccharothrix violaceirubra TaxID=413306 RepID=A0A7W7SZY1_9PSEU|nr:hypothetical protein [Saccharothrix violaceirubra]MBB4963432.1 hypothetical protein [Saccharothrix violaceirubra]
MPRFRLVEVYPVAGGWSRPWIDDPDADDFAKVSRGICDLYSTHLAEADLRHAVSALRIFVGDYVHPDTPAAGDGHAGVLSPTSTDRPEGYEHATVRVPTGFAAWPLGDRQRVVLDAVHEAALGVATLRGWEPDAFQRARKAVESADFTFTWTGPWKSSPGRRWRARCAFRSLPDGFGRLVLEVAGPEDEAVCATSSEQIAWTTMESYRRAARTLRWATAARLEVIPCVVLGFAGDKFVAELTAEAGRLRLDDVQAAAPFGSSRA